MTWRQGLVLLFALVLSSWVTLAALAWGYLHWKQGIATVSFVDIAAPHRWSKLKPQIGDHYLREGRQAIEKQDYPRAISFLRAGLARKPTDAASRLLLARIYQGAERPDLAKYVLTGHLSELSHDLAYLDASLRFLLDFHFDRELRQLCGELLATQRNPAAQSVVAHYAATLAYLRGNHEEASGLIHSHRLDATPEGALLLARIDADEGFSDLALTRLAALVGSGTASDHTFSLIGRLLQETGRARDAELNATLHLSHAPLSPAPRISLLHLHLAQKKHAQLAREADDYLTLFANDATALLALGNFAAQAGQPDLAERVHRRFLSLGWPQEAPSLLVAEAHLVAGNPTRCLELLAAASPATDRNSRSGPVVESLRALAHSALNHPDEAQLHLDHLLTQPNLRAAHLESTARRLDSLGRSRQAQLLLTRAVVLDPLNQAALDHLVRLEARHRSFDTLPHHARRLLQMRRPSPATITLIHRAWGSDLNLFHPDHATVLGELEQALTHDPSPES